MLRIFKNINMTQNKDDNRSSNDDDDGKNEDKRDEMRQNRIVR